PGDRPGPAVQRGQLCVSGQHEPGQRRTIQERQRRQGSDREDVRRPSRPDRQRGEQVDRQYQPVHHDDHLEIRVRETWGALGRLKSAHRPYGDWAWYLYDSDQNRAYEYGPWGDTGFPADLNLNLPASNAPMTVRQLNYVNVGPDGAPLISLD